MLWLNISRPLNHFSLFHLFCSVSIAYLERGSQNMINAQKSRVKDGNLSYCSNRFVPHPSSVCLSYSDNPYAWRNTENSTQYATTRISKCTLMVFLLCWWVVRRLGAFCRWTLRRKSNLTACWDILSWNWSKSWQRLDRLRLLWFSWTSDKHFKTDHLLHSTKTVFSSVWAKTTILTTKCSTWFGHIHLPAGKAVSGGSRQSMWNRRGQ